MQHQKKQHRRRCLRLRWRRRSIRHRRRSRRHCCQRCCSIRRWNRRYSRSHHFPLPRSIHWRRRFPQHRPSRR
jgi:hypothetical protein